MNGGLAGLGLPAASAGVYTDFQSLDRLSAEAKQDSPKALKEAARQFEALFLQMMLQSMRKANESFGGGLLDSDQTRFYQGLFDQQLSVSMASQSGLGLAQLLVRQLGGKRAAGPGRGAANVSGATARHGQGRLSFSAPQRPSGAVAGAAGTASSGPAAKAVPQQAPSPVAFVRRLWPLARDAAAALGVSPAVLVAQAALETGWGRAVIQGADGRSSHNLFGIKAGPEWSGESVAVPTVEYQGGVVTRRVEPFRAYGSDAESFADYVRVLRQNPRYRAALRHAGDPQAYVGALQRAGYATDPNYAEKVRGVLESGTLRDAVTAVKDSAALPLT